ncbi:two-component sensor histidine kinase [Acidovorax sp. DW039]|uniref:histidine kinase dimerization/phospho-acceptor domain-containing protein n=1 Tax=Acidovorax sp. DW039 TaxID=3095606 RepID=UPI003092D837|nr:two-component sensor histidine kinase [Acidovorax sp. DW039]
MSKPELAADPQSAPRRSSLTRQLLLWSLGALMLVWISFVVIGYKTGVHEADELTDGHLASVAALLLNVRATEAVDASRQTQRAPMPWLKAHDYQQSLSVVQWDAEGKLLSISGDVPVPPFSPDEGFKNIHLGPDAKPWRSFSQWDAEHLRKIMVLVQLQERDDLAEDIAEQMIEPGLWLLPVVALALGLALRRGLRPLYDLSADVAALDVSSQQRLAQRHAWSEFASVVASINTLLERQQEALVRERRLANEVAHELRTPLSSIALQASALDGGLDEHAQREALDRIRQDALRAGHVLNQLLALARTSRAEMYEAKTPVDLVALARAVCAEYAQAAWQRGDELEVMAPDSVTVQGHPVLLELVLRNLIENALKHTPSGTRIAVQVVMAPEGGEVAEEGVASPLQRGIWLQVCDDGQRARAHPADGEGMQTRPVPVDSLHLGHEIVSRVAWVHQAEFGRAAAPAPFTTCFRLTFPTEAASPRG